MSNLFDDLGMSDDFFKDLPDERNTRTKVAFTMINPEDIKEELPPSVQFGKPSLEAPPDLRLRSHMMKLMYHDDRINDPHIRDWMEQRRLGVGASEIAVLFGLSEWSDVRQLWHEKVYGCSYEAGSELFHWGHTMEPVIAAEFQRRTGEIVDDPPSEIMIGEKPHHRASLDRVILEDDVPVAALELKNLHEGRFAEYKLAGPSIGYLLQLQYQMAVAGYEYGYLAVLFGGQRWAAWRVVASPSVQREIFRRVDEFWTYVENKVEPPAQITGRGVYKHDDQTLKLEDPEWERKLLALDDIRLQKTKLEKEEKMLKQQIKEVLGDANAAQAGAMRASISLSTRKSLDTTRLKAECPDIVEKFMKEATVKTMRISRRKK